MVFAVEDGSTVGVVPSSLWDFINVSFEVTLLTLDSLEERQIHFLRVRKNLIGSLYFCKQLRRIFCIVKVSVRVQLQRFPLIGLLYSDRT